jgi:hypothetical protein
MKPLVILFASAFILFSANSCKQCSTCRKYPATDVKLCKSDFASEDSYAQAFRQQEALGYNCE